MIMHILKQQNNLYRDIPTTHSLYQKDIFQSFILFKIIIKAVVARNEQNFTFISFNAVL